MPTEVFYLIGIAVVVAGVVFALKNHKVVAQAKAIVADAIGATPAPVAAPAPTLVPVAVAPAPEPAPVPVPEKIKYVYLPAAPTPAPAPAPAVEEPWNPATHGGCPTKESWDAWQASRANSQRVTDNLGKLGVDVPVMRPDVVSALLAPFDAELAASGEEIAWFKLGQGQLGDRTQIEFALINRGMAFLEFNQTFNKWNSHGTPAALLPPGFQNPKKS